MLANPDFAKWSARQVTPDGFVDNVDVVGDVEQGFTITLRRRVPAGVIPAQFQRLIGDELELRQAEVWEPESDGKRSGTVAMEITGTPVIMTGTVQLLPMAGGTRQVYDVNIEAQIPFFGSVIESAIEEPVREGLHLMEQAGRAWLAGAVTE